MLVVKLGGSLYGSSTLKKWLHVLKVYSEQQPVIIVPGGGPFADQVRATQKLHHFDDHHAHHMAILAMAQFGLLISAITPQCKTFYYPSKKFIPSNNLFIWLPDQQLLSQSTLPHNWNISSDSLALWLANELQAEQLALVKSVNLIPSHSIEELATQGIVDNGFQQLFNQYYIPSQILMANDWEHFPTCLSAQRLLSS